jgi:S-adenosylmethionine hydrolase
MTIITLTTDFGLEDGYVGAMKGVIWRIAPEARIADITHQIGPQNILHGAMVLASVAPYYPDGAIHVAVVDPGVGMARRPLMATIDAQYFIGPDNGLVSLWLAKAEEEGLAVQCFHLNQPGYWLPKVTNVFHGRDIFAPSAAHLAAGTPPKRMGAPVDDPVRLQLPAPQRTSSGWLGEIIYIDHFGNLVTNFRPRQPDGMSVSTVRVKSANISGGLVRAFGERPPGEMAALINSSGYLEIVEVNGSAARRLGATVGDPVEVEAG